MQDLTYNSAGNTGWYTQDSPWNYNPPTYGDTETSGGFNSWDWSDYANDPRFLKLIGFEGNPFISGNVGDSGGNQNDFGLSPDFLEKANQFERRQMTGENWGGELSSIFRNGKEVSPSLRQFKGYSEGPEWDLATALAMAAIAPGGFIGGVNSGIGAGLGLSGAAAMGVNAAFNSGVTAAGSGASDRDVLSSMGVAAGMPFLPNLGQMAGIENTYLANAFDGGLKGAGIASLTDNDVNAGAIIGALPGLGSYLGERFMDTSYVPTSSGQNLINETNMASRLPRGGLSSFVDTPQMSQGVGYVPQNSPLAYTNTPQEQSNSGFELPDLNNFFGKLMPNNPQQWGNLAEGLGGLVMGGLQYRKARKMEKQLGANREAYSTNLRRQLERRDAASGRRSNYAGRETQLQASLAELDSRNIPVMASLSNSQFGGLAGMFQSGLRYAGKQGMFGEQYTPGYRASLPPSSYLMGLGNTVPLPDYSEPMSSWADDPRRRGIRLGGS